MPQPVAHLLVVRRQQLARFGVEADVTRRVRPQTLTHWTEIPAIPAAAFKELDLSCLPAEERNAVFLSSGTSGQTPSRHFHNPQSLAVYEASAFPWFTTHLLPSGDQPGGLTDAPWQLAILTPPPSSAPNSSLVHMFDTIRRAFGFSETAFLASLAETGWSLDLEAVRKILEESSTTKQPLTILGTAFSFVHLLDHLADCNLHFRLPPEAMVEKVKFTAPVVVEDTTIEVSMANMDDLNKKGNVEAPTEDVVVEVKDEGPKVIETPVQAEIFTVVEEQPGYPGGEEARISYLQQNIKYPEEAKELGIQGKVFVTFVVEVDGSITDVRVLRGIGGGCDEEAIRVVKSMPKWVPGKQRGVPVRVQFNLPIKFTLQ